MLHKIALVTFLPKVASSPHASLAYAIRNVVVACVGDHSIGKKMRFLEFIINKDVLLIKVETTVIDLESIHHANIFLQWEKGNCCFFQTKPSLHFTQWDPRE